MLLTIPARAEFSGALAISARRMDIRRRVFAFAERHQLFGAMHVQATTSDPVPVKVSVVAVAEVLTAARPEVSFAVHTGAERYGCGKVCEHAPEESVQVPAENGRGNGIAPK